MKKVEDFDTSTESKEIEQKEQDQDTVTEDEDDPDHIKEAEGVIQNFLRACLLVFNW